MNEDFPLGNRIVDFEAISKGLEKCTNCQQGTIKNLLPHLDIPLESFTLISISIPFGKNPEHEHTNKAAFFIFNGK